MSTSELREQIFSLLYSEKKPDLAILKLNNIIKNAPERSDAIALKAYSLNKLANSLREWAYSEDARREADRALELNPDDDIALTSKGWALIDLGRAQEALPVLKRATVLNSRNE
jgi:tetratricopeptide (TPR) repeat protein